MDGFTLKLKEGVRLSAFDDGSEKKSYLISCGERNWKVSQIIYYIALEMNEIHSTGELCRCLKENHSIDLSVEKMEQVLEQIFIQNGLLEGTTAVTKRKRNKMIWGRITLFPSNVISRIKIFKFLFEKKCIYFCGSIVLIWMLYLLLCNSNDQVINELMGMHFTNIVICYGFVFFAGLIHEFGHSTAAMQNGSKPGRIGAGIYFIMPVLFSDVSDVWKLKRPERVIVDLGGIYLQGIFLVFVYFINIYCIHNYLLNIGILISGFQIVSNLNPFIKLDGYWILADYMGVSEIKEIVLHTWNALFCKMIGKTHKYERVSRDKEIVIYLYSACTLFFYVYFIKFFIRSAIAAYFNFRNDIMHICQNSDILRKATIYGAVQYLSSRATSFVVLIFMIRLLMYGISGLIKKYNSVRRKKVVSRKEEMEEKD